MRYLVLILSIMFLSCSENKCSKWDNLNADSARVDFKKENYRFFKPWHGCDSSGTPINTLGDYYHMRFSLIEPDECFSDGIYEYEEEMIRLMESINGKGWYNKYELLVDSIANNPK